MEENELKNRIILSISSDIGASLALNWLESGFNVSGTYRNWNSNCDYLKSKGANLIYCDLMNKESINTAVTNLNSNGLWDIFVIATGSQDPVGNFLKTNFDEWENSINANFTAQLRFLHGILPNRNINTKLKPLVLFFAGGGTNGATINYSAYTISKIASIKICELLDAEINDTRFSIIGPGWVKTKIHESTIKSKDFAGENYFKTVEMLEGDKCFPMEKVVECCNWVAKSPIELIGGRNFSAVFDKWGQKELDLFLLSNKNNYKLRRFGN